jgi:hypothetical protein
VVLPRRPGRVGAREVVGEWGLYSSGAVERGVAGNACSSEGERATGRKASGGRGGDVGWAPLAASPSRRGPCAGLTVF